jgi:hypothetical protein
MRFSRRPDADSLKKNKPVDWPSRRYPVEGEKTRITEPKRPESPNPRSGKDHFERLAEEQTYAVQTGIGPITRAKT